ncbi:MAG: type I restriction endonuclease [Elainellaceae cyanobacterium]
MVQTLFAKDVTLSELGERVGLHQADDRDFFQEWQSGLPTLTDEDRQRLDRIKAGFLNLLEHPPMLENTVKMVVLSPLLDLVDAYLKPLRIAAEPSFQIVVEDDGAVIKGNVDVLVLRNRLWVMAIEAKRAAVDVDEGRAQLLSYMLANPVSDGPTFGLLTNGRNFLFIKLVREGSPQYGLSRLYSLVNPDNDLYDVLAVLRQLIN